MTLILGMLGFKALAADTKTKPRYEVMPLITMDTVPLGDAVKNLARQEGINYIFDPAVLTSFGGVDGCFVHGPYITTKWTNVTARQALDDVLHDYNLKLNTNPVTTVFRITLAARNIQPAPASQLGQDTNETLHLIKMEDVPLRDAITNLANTAKLGVRFHLATPKEEESDSDDPLRSMVNLRWENLTAKQALVALLDNYGLLMVQYPDSAIVHIIAKRQPAP
ncbi:MAG TPA: hypothetical protein VN048_09145 [Verrucomicrobiae bacterium]|nr:hypothetical protein [Verrucomicrobiae bacterium]